MTGFLWVDLPGTELSREDREIITHPAISGVILFAHNYESPEQLRQLTRDIASVSPSLMISVDQEGGRVQRFLSGFTRLPAMSHWGRQFQESQTQTLRDFSQMLSTMVSELRQVGVYSTLAPVLDIDYQRNTVIGERSFGHHADLIAKLGEFFIDRLHALQMPVMGKHFPGHGWVTQDSHDSLPVDEREWMPIQKQDLQPFARLANRLDAIMPAHIVYSTIDSLPVAFSSHWLQQILRKQLQFTGLIVSDDLTMQGAAPLGDYEDRARLALEAGCDLLIVCRSRAGVVDILDRVRKPKDPEFLPRLHRYRRFFEQS